MAKILLVILVVYLVCVENSVNSATIHYKCKSCHSKSISKKGIFLSRGWGAGGMPFGVLYLNPSYSKNLVDEPEPPKSQQTNYNNNLGRSPKTGPRKPHSVPQLFVSYGWGPLGK